MGYALKASGSPRGHIAHPSLSSCHNLIPPHSFGSQSLSEQRILYFIMEYPFESTKNLNYCAFICPSNASSSLAIYLATKPLKSGTSSMRWRIVGTDYSSMKDFISNGIVGKFSFFKDMLYLPYRASISSCM
jgi:hypothetical protein